MAKKVTAIIKLQVDAAKAKSKDVKRKGPAVLAAEPEQKRSRGRDEPRKDNRPLCAFHNVSGVQLYERLLPLWLLCRLCRRQYD